MICSDEALFGLKVASRRLRQARCHGYCSTTSSHFGNTILLLYCLPISKEETVQQ
jgi:hypothetical protein